MCGIFGKIAREKEKFDIGKFNALGVINDERGGDSAGIFIDGEVEIGVKDEKLYSNFLKSSLLLEKTKEARIALGHTRKASVGGVSEEKAQPICIYNEKGEIDFVLLHNGTIFNYLELAKKYIPEFDIKGLTDSQVMANIFYFCGYDVLAEYEGAAAMVIVDYRSLNANGDPCILMFKGSSNKYRYSTTEEEERPLFLTMNKDSLWFSSISKMLSAINYPEKTLTLKANTLIKVELSDEIILVKERDIDRSKLFQYKTTYEHTNEYATGNYKSRTYNDNGPLVPIVNKYKNGKNKNVTTPSTKYTNWFDVSESAVRDKIALFSDGLYYVNDQLAHGKIYLDFYGYIIGSEDGSPYYTQDYYLYKGRLIPNEHVFNMLTDVAKHLDISGDNFALNYSECIDKYGYIPVVNIQSTDPISVEIFEQEDFNESRLFNGPLRTMFSYTGTVWMIKNGSIESKTIGQSVYKSREYFDMFVNMWSDKVVNYEEELKEMKKYILSRS